MSDTLRIVLTLYPEADSEDTGRWPGDDEACNAALNAIPGALIGDDIIIRSMTAEVVRAAAEQPAAPELSMSMFASRADMEAAMADRAPPGPAQPGAAPTWISVEDRLPEPDMGEVLVWLTGGRCAFDEWHTYREDPTGMGGPTMDMGLMWRDYDFDEITHWMPLPGPPGAAPLPAVPQPAPALSQEEQWNRAGFEPYKFHPSASHVDPAYRDGWNAALRAVERAATLAASTPAEPLIPLSAALAAVPPGSWCDPQKVADDLRAIPVAAPQADAADARDAARYRWLREQDWFSGDLCVLRDPKNVLTRSVNLGVDCPSRGRLDAAIDAALSAPTEPAAGPAKGDAL